MPKFTNVGNKIYKDGHELSMPELLENLNMAEIRAFEDPVIHPRMKAGCNGEFYVETTWTCPQCWALDEYEEDPDCEFCDGDKEKEQQLVVPWTTNKDIFKAMCTFKAQALREDLEDGD